MSEVEIIEPHVELITPVEQLLTYPKLIEKACRTCYASEDKIEEGSDERLISMCIKNGHHSILEHAVVSYRFICSRACYDRKTEVYTSSGWKRFKDLNLEDEILTFNETKQIAEFQKPTNYINYRYTGTLHRYKSKNIDLCVTPDHNMYIQKYDTRKDKFYELIPSHDINVNRFYLKKAFDFYPKQTFDNFYIKGYSYKRYYGNKFYSSKVEKTTKDHIVTNSFIKLLAWYIAEGSTYYNKIENSYTITITQLKQQHRNHIMRIVESCGFTATRDKKSIKFKDLTIGRYFKSLGLSHKKYIPQDIFNRFNKETAQIFLNEYIKGDGSHELNGHRRIYTTSKKLADQLQMLCFIAGYTAAIWLDNCVGQTHIGPNGKEIKWNHIGYIVSLSEKGVNKNGLIKKNKHFKLVNYDDYVYCVTVPNHIILTRRNRKISWCGNCSHQLVRSRIASYSQASQRFIDSSKKGMQIIVPPKIKEKDSEAYNIFVKMCQSAYDNYLWMRNAGVLPEDARFLLPNACATNVFTTMNLRAWRHFIEIRGLNPHSQWEIRKLALDILYELNNYIPVFFKDLMESLKND